MNDKEYCLYFRKDGYCKPQNYEDAKTIYISQANVKNKKLYEHPTKSGTVLMVINQLL